MLFAYSYQTLAAAALVVGVLALVWKKIQFRLKYKLPPGPRGLPVFGNVFQIPLMHQGPYLSEQAEKYGEMFTLQFAQQTWVFLNSSRVVNDLMEKRSAIYSSRARMPYASGLMSRDCRIVVQPYGAKWRALRKIMHGLLNGSNAAIFVPFQERESQFLLGDFVDKPDLWWKSLQRFSNSIIMSVVFGKHITGKEGVDENGKSNIDRLFDTSQEFLTALQPGANLVDTFNVLDRLPKPLKWWTKRGDAAHQRLLDVYTTEVKDLKERLANGTCPPCFASNFLKNPETEKLGEVQALFALGSIMEAGSDTSRVTLSQIIAAAATDKRWAKKAQEELDRVLGDAERLPTFADRKSLPYISAVTKESIRWRPLAEIGMAHMLTQDDEYEGYKFPAGTMFTWNAWHISNNPDEYPDPLRFWPERWLDSSIQGFNTAKLDSPLADVWGFGMGRRVCTGYHLGDTNVWIGAARLLYCFDFEQVEGQEIDTLNMNTSEHRRAPFKVKIKVRSPKHRELIERGR